MLQQRWKEPLQQAMQDTSVSVNPASNQASKPAPGFACSKHVNKPVVAIQQCCKETKQQGDCCL
jgi:hypothetical protein